MIIFSCLFLGVIVFNTLWSFFCSSLTTNTFEVLAMVDECLEQWLRWSYIFSGPVFLNAAILRFLKLAPQLSILVCGLQISSCHTSDRWYRWFVVLTECKSEHTWQINLNPSESHIKHIISVIIVDHAMSAVENQCCVLENSGRGFIRCSIADGVK